MPHLKGGGQITEKEGEKATQAAARLNEAQNPPAFRDALAEVRFYADLARRRANGETIPETFYQSTLTQADTPEADQETDEDLSKYFTLQELDGTHSTRIYQAGKRAVEAGDMNAARKLKRMHQEAVQREAAERSVAGEAAYAGGAGVARGIAEGASVVIAS